MDHIIKTIQPTKLDAAPTRDLEKMPVLSLREANSSGNGTAPGCQNLVSVSRAMQRIRRQIESVARLDAPILILGENGTGKKSIARHIHEISPRSKYRFEKITCEGLPEDLLDSELFGHEEHANGAASRAIGKFESCANGTLLLEEISRVPIGLQAKILHAVRDGEFFRKGGASTISSKVRTIATSHIDIEQSISDKKLRADLFYVLGAFTIELPPLRERKEDIPFLLKYFMERLSMLHGRTPKRFSAALIEACQEYSWPGNLRELENLVHRYLVMGDESLTPHDLRARPSSLFLIPTAVAELKRNSPAGVDIDSNHSGMGLKGLVRNLRDETEINAIRDALQQTNWNRRKAALLLNISYRGLLYKIREYRLFPPYPS